MIVDENTAVWAADEFIDYFKNFTSIEDYLRFVKMEVISSLGSLDSLHDEFLNVDIHPQDMEFKIVRVGKGGLDQKVYDRLLAVTSSHDNQKNIPGRELKWIVYEKNLNKVVGFVRFGSPIINSKPRNNWLGKAPDLSLFNRHAAMGFTIVPSQPFGYNYLGGKLLALMCCSHFARESLNEAFDKEIALFETTSLYGSATSASQYDGLKPFIRFRGLTESKFPPLLHERVFHRLHNRFSILNNGPLTSNAASSKKMKRQTKMISIIRNSLQEHNAVEKLERFNEIIAMAFDLTQKKRFYTSDFGYSNVREVILGEQEKLVRGPNWDKFYLDEYMIPWWKNKATKRYEKLKREGRLRDKVELWVDGADEIQIIR